MSRPAGSLESARSSAGAVVARPDRGPLPARGPAIGPSCSPATSLVRRHADRRAPARRAARRGPAGRGRGPTRVRAIAGAAAGTDGGPLRRGCGDGRASSCSSSAGAGGWLRASMPSRSRRRSPASSARSGRGSAIGVRAAGRDIGGVVAIGEPRAGGWRSAASPASSVRRRLRPGASTSGGPARSSSSGRGSTPRRSPGPGRWASGASSSPASRARTPRLPRLGGAPARSPPSPAPFAVLVLDGAIRRPIAGPVARPPRGAGRPRGRDRRRSAGARVRRARARPLPPPARPVRVRAGARAGREGRWAGLAGLRRFAGGAYLEAGWVRFGGEPRSPVPLADLERFAEARAGPLGGGRARRPSATRRLGYPRRPPSRPPRALVRDPATTRALGARASPRRRAGDLICLWGDLGAGKTQFAKGFGAGLGVEDRQLAELHPHGRVRGPPAAVPPRPVPARRRGRGPRRRPARRAPGERRHARRVAGADGERLPAARLDVAIDGTRRRAADDPIRAPRPGARPLPRGRSP